MTARDIATLFLIAAIWGSSYIFIRVIVPAVGPWGMVGGRMVISAVVMYGALRVARLSWGLPRLLPHYVLMAFLSSFLAQYLIASAALLLNAGTLAILNTTAPLFSALLLFLIHGEALSARHIGGMAFGMLGVSMVVGFAPLPLTLPVVLAFGGTLGAACSYAFSNIYASRKLANRPALELAFAQSFFAGILALPFAVPQTFAAANQGLWSAKVLASLVVLAVVCTALANGLFYGLMKRTGPTVSLSVTFLIPAFSLLWSWLFLGETITPWQFGGFCVILLALFLVTGKRTA